MRATAQKAEEALRDCLDHDGDLLLRLMVPADFDKEALLARVLPEAIVLNGSKIENITHFQQLWSESLSVDGLPVEPHLTTEEAIPALVIDNFHALDDKTMLTVTRRVKPYFENGLSVVFVSELGANTRAQDRDIYQSNMDGRSFPLEIVSE